MTQIAILAAGLGTRLGRPHPKPLTVLSTGETILRRQIRMLGEAFSDDVRITVVVGYKLDLIVEAAPDVRFAYNEVYDQTNTSKSLLKALRLSDAGGVMWMNGDVVFDAGLMAQVKPLMDAEDNFVCVNTSSVSDEEVKYTLDENGSIAELSKQVVGGLGEAVGINYVSGPDKAALIASLEACDANDYFERGIELSIASDGLHWPVVDISAHTCVEIDFQEDLERANELAAPGS